jgi:proteasome lid subunit RPN8/RPN11
MGQPHTPQLRPLRALCLARPEAAEHEVAGREQLEAGHANGRETRTGGRGFVSAVVTLTLEASNTLRAHAGRVFPEECVGAVLSDGVTVLPLANSAENRRCGFAVSARDCLWVEREAEARGLEVLGFYHSHPDGPAEPSASDVAHATPGRWMFIVRVVSGVAQAARAFSMDGLRWLESPLDFARGERLGLAHGDTGP